MIRRSRPWQLAGAAFVVINVLGLVWAASMREPGHAVLHAGLLIGGFILWQVMPWGRRDVQQQVSAPADRVEYLQTSVDAIALEVERIGEAQRFSEKLRTQRIETPDSSR